MVPLLQERVPRVTLPATSRMAHEEHDSHVPPGIQEFERGSPGHPGEDEERDTRQRYSRWERDIVSDRQYRDTTREGYLPSRHRQDISRKRRSILTMDPGVEDMGPYEPHLTERIPRDRVFKRALSYRAYRLKNTDQSVTPRQADRLRDYQKRLKVTLYAPLFDGKEQIEVLNFLSQCKRECDDTGSPASVQV